MEKEYFGCEWEETYNSEANSTTKQCTGRGRRAKKDYFISCFVGFTLDRI